MSISNVKAGIYARVSTDEQAKDGTSLDTQRERCRAFVQARGWELADEYVDDGVSGSRSSRPELDRLMADCRSGALQAVVFSKFDRFSRNRQHLENACAELDELGVALASVSENVDGSTATGQAFRALLGVFANLERDMIMERTGAGLRAVAAAGYWPGGPAPYGFTLKRNDRRAQLVIRDDEAKLLRTAVSLVLDEGCSTWETAARLNALGYRPRRAARWNHANLRRTLLDASLSGEWVYARPRHGKQSRYSAPITVPIPPLIARERHQALRAALAATSTGPEATRKRHFYLLAGGRLTGPCGSHFHGVFRKDRAHRHYRCMSSRPEAPCRCSCRRLDADLVEDAVWTVVVDFLSQPDKLIRIARDYLDLRDQQPQTEPEQLESLDSKVDSLELAISSIVVEYAKAGLPATAVQQATVTLQEELQVLKCHRQRLQTARHQTLEREDRDQRLRHLAECAHSRLPQMTAGERHKVLSLLEIKVDVLGWHPCHVCTARGKVKGGAGGIRCPACGGGRHVPALRIKGTVYDRLAEDLSHNNVGNLARVTRRRCRCC